MFVSFSWRRVAFMGITLLHSHARHSWGGGWVSGGCEMTQEIFLISRCLSEGVFRFYCLVVVVIRRLNSIGQPEGKRIKIFYAEVKSPLRVSHGEKWTVKSNHEVWMTSLFLLELSTFTGGQRKVRFLRRVLMMFVCRDLQKSVSLHRNKCTVCRTA